MSGKILIVDDDEDVRLSLGNFFQKRGYLVKLASTAEQALDQLKGEPFDLTILDVKLPGLSGIESLRFMKKMDPYTPVIMMTGHDTREIAVEAVSQGAYDYFAKPVNLWELEATIVRAMAETRLARQDISDGFIGESEPIKHIKQLIVKVAPLQSTILITGESGTGKELVADMIHRNSRRPGSPFIKINCAAIPDGLLESELFGYEKGAFTGAYASRYGKFELAHGGTILLDEISDMPLSIQAKLLRVVEQKEVVKLGGQKPTVVDTRIIASTNKQLTDSVRMGKFREDLYYRLNVVTLRLPPLRERMEDLALLMDHFLGKINLKLGTGFAGLSTEAWEILCAYHWPGNVRELANVVERAAIFGKGTVLDGSEVEKALQGHSEATDLGPQIFDFLACCEKGSSTLNEVLEKAEKSLITAALLKSHGIQTEAAQMLGLQPKNLWKKIKKHSIDVDSLINHNNDFMPGWPGRENT